MPLQKSFRGLVNHLGQFSLGNIKFEPSPVIGVDISAEDFIQPIEYLYTSGTLSAARQVATHQQVPEGEFWRARYVGVRGVDNNNTTAWTPVWSDDGSRFFGLETVTTGASAQFAVGSTSLCGFQFTGQEGFVLRPGMRLGFDLIVSAGGGTSLDFTTVIAYQKIQF